VGSLEVLVLPLTFIAAGLVGLALLPTAYLSFLAVLGWPHHTKKPTARTLRFRFLVPAHNEMQGIASTVESLLAVTWPRTQFEVVVVADNCSDDTAAVARAAGASVLERHNTELRGKGYALELGFDTILEKTDADAVVVVDADTIVSTNVLESFAARIEGGALAMQAEYGVRNVHASWRTEMMALALGMFHALRNNARERLKLSAGLRGNGMCFTRECLVRFPPRAYGLVEDVEHGLALGRGGVRVVAAVDACVLGEMVSGGKASESQRRRWEDGRAALKRDVLPGVVREALARRSLLLLDLAIDLLIPPLSTVGLLVVAATAVGGVRSAICHRLGFDVDVLTALVPLPALLLSLYVLRGMQLSGLGWGAVLVLLKAPIYVAWKIGLKLRGKPEVAWVRTARESESSSSSSS
jgi:GT2 family glycosyltransferase